MTLRQQRCLFTRLTCQLGVWIFEQPGYEVAFNEVVRMPIQAKANAESGAGIANSLHLVGLAVDFLLYINGDYQYDTEAYIKIGAKWESMHPLCRWGGRFAKQDGNHFSSERDGVR